jgi:hypothetical protein
MIEAQGAADPDEPVANVSGQAAFMEGAWYSFISWAWRFPEMRAEFEHDTGTKLLPQARSGIEQIVDKVTGAAAGEAAAFVEWATRKHWGIEAAPKLYQQALRKKRSS